MLFFVLGFSFASESAAQDCSNIDPWINEFDYDSDDGGINNDRDEFIEIAAPAGTDLSGIRILAVEGNSGFLSLPCLSGLGVTTGNSYFDLAIPSGTIVGDDTGTGVGFVVVCLGTTSNDIQAAGFCDVVLPTQFSDSSLKNGSLTPPLGVCPDGVLMLEGDGSLLDAISYEGSGPVGDAGSYGHYFNPPETNYFLSNSGPYDSGYPVFNSLAIVTPGLGRAISAGDWALMPAHGHSPGSINPGQELSCGPPPDTDGDGFADDEDNCPLSFNPGQEDIDEDGIGDECDNCPDEANVDQIDSDQDGEGDVCECNPDPGSGYWEVTYNLGNGSYVDVRNTPLGAGDQFNAVGPGSMTIRFEADQNGDILDGGSGEIVQLDLTQEFTIETDVLGFQAFVTTDLESSIPDDRWNGNPFGYVDPGSNLGSLSGTDLSFFGALQDYRTLGSVSCVGNACSQGGLPGDGTPQPIDQTIQLDLLVLSFSGGGGTPGSLFTSNEIQTEATDAADTFLGFRGEEVSRIFVPGTPAEICDPDSDNDGFPDSEDNCPDLPNDQSDVNSDGVGDACQSEDADSDGWPDAEDNCPLVANPDQSDLNSDGQGDICQSGDSDIDGWPDSEDNCPSMANADQANSDGDGLGDLCDNCAGVTNQDQSDLDGDGFGDLCQPNDSDQDGWGDLFDNCPGAFNPDQLNSDADPAGDVCDLCPLDANNDEDSDGICGDVDACPNDPLNDSDGDGLCAGEDSCPNDSLNDSDGDGICGDIDSCPNDPLNDLDGDGVCAENDNCPLESNPLQEDQDLDGVGDVCDEDIGTPVPLLSPISALSVALVLGGLGWIRIRYGGRQSE